LIVAIHQLCDDPLYEKRKIFAISSLGNRFIIKLNFNRKEQFLKCSCYVFSNLECQRIFFQIIFLLFINSDGMHLCIVYYNLDNYDVCARCVGHDDE
jgi:hypothetical protein